MLIRKRKKEDPDIMGMAEESKSMNIPIDKVPLSNDWVKLEVIKEQISHKLIIDSCSSIDNVHAILKFSTEAPPGLDIGGRDPEGFYIKAIHPFVLNNKKISSKDGYQV